MCKLLAGLLVMLATSAAVGASRRVLILVLPAVKALPTSCGAQQQALERALAGAAGVTVQSYERLCRQLLVHRKTVEQDAIGKALASAREYFLAQRFDDMVATLTRLEQQPQLLELSRPENFRQAAALNQLVGVAYAAQGEKDRATERFRAALDLSPSEGLDPLLYPPRVVALFHQARAERAASTVVDVDLQSSVAMQVAVDGKRNGSTPLRIRLRSGRHYLRAWRLGYRPQARVLEVSAQSTLQLQPERLLPGERRAQLAELLARGELDGFDAEHLAALGAAAGADRLLRWRLQGDRLEAELLPADGGRVLAAASAPAHRPADLWSALNAAQQPRRPTSTAKPVWKRWWFWAAGGGVGAAAVVTAVLVLARPETAVLIRFK